MERVMGIEPTLSAWEAEVLPLNYTRETGSLCRRAPTGNAPARAGDRRQKPRPRLRNTPTLSVPLRATEPLRPASASSPNTVVRAPSITVP